MNSCESCESTENLIEAGGQFCGGTWWICKKCDDEAKRFAEFMKSDVYMKALKSDKCKQAVRDGTLSKYKWVVVRRPEYAKVSFLKILWKKVSKYFSRL